MGEESQRTRTVIVLSGPDALPAELIDRVEQLGFHPLACVNASAAEQAVLDAEDPIHCALLPASLADRNLKRELKSLRRAGSLTGLHLVAVGEEPGRAERKLLRNAGVRYALWNPVEASTLRFQLNRLTRYDPATDEIRRARRVPTRLPARVSAGGRSRDATVYSLSESGAFLETQRAAMNGARVEVEFLLNHRTLAAPATVAFANVPGNLQRPNLPLGMGVRFGELPSGTQRALIDYVESQLPQLEV